MISASAFVPAGRERVFDFLADLENHWSLAAPSVEVVALAGPRGARHGGLVVVRGPFGIRRSAATRIRDARPPESICGTASLGARTTATLIWRLAVEPHGTRVRLGATIKRAGTVDRILLALGGRLWLRRLFATTLRALASRVDGRGADGHRVTAASPYATRTGGTSR
jgi:Polyketide cyclase / dehydrase and lipid transport